MAKVKIKISANMSKKQAENTLKKIEAEKARKQAVSKAMKAKDSLDKIK